MNVQYTLEEHSDRCLSAATVDNRYNVMRQRALLRKWLARMKIENFGPFVLSRLDCDVYQKLTISRVMCNECLL